MDTETIRSRGKKLSSNKLSALERLKKARQGEKIEDEEPEEEEMYDYVEEDDYYEEEDEFESKSKKNSNKSHSSGRESGRDKQEKSQTHTKRHLTKDKVSHIDESQTDAKSDIRNAFFKAAAASSSFKPKVDNQTVMNDDDDIANEIMEELKKKSTTTKTTQNRPKPQMPSQMMNTKSPMTHKPAFSQIPFSISNTISLSPAHKRKLSPTNNTSAEKAHGGEMGRVCKKIELDDHLVQQLFDDNEQEPAVKESKSNEHKLLNDVSNKTNIIKNEPIEMTEVHIKKEYIDEHEDEALENAQLMAQLSLESANNSLLAQQLNLPQIKQENADADLQMLVRNQANTDKFLFYWLDAYEDYMNSIGTIYLFGKMPVVKPNVSSDSNLSFLSVCCIIKNMPRVVHILPRKYKRSVVKTEPGCEPEQVTMDQVKNEISGLMHKHKISSFKMRVVKKYYAFDRRVNNNTEGIPFEAEYLEVEYLATNQENRHLPADLEGEYFSCIFGSHKSYLEHFLIETKLKGPCWLMIKNAKRHESNGSMLSWSKIEYTVDNYKNISSYTEGVTLEDANIKLPPTPPLTVLTLLMRTMLNSRNQEHEIVSACGLVNTKFYIEKATLPSSAKSQIYDSYFCALSKPSNGVFPYDLDKFIKSMQHKIQIELCGNERSLLAFLLGKMQSLDVDIIVGHDLFGFNFDILLNRCHVNKVPHWSRLGRLKRSQMPTISNHNRAMNNLAVQQRIQTVFSGRLLCDVMLSAKELLTKCKSFELNELANHILFKKDASSVSPIMRDFEEEKNVANYYNNSQLLYKFLQLNMMDATYIMRIANDLQCLQLAYQITCIAGNVLSRTLLGGRSERNEYLLLHAFHDKEFILPDKQSSASRNKALAISSAKSGAKNNKKNSTMIKSETSTQMEIENEDDEDRFLSTMTMNEENETMHKEAGKSTHTSTNSYTGGLVLEPKVGFYDKFILLLDFNSLYPSIIQEFNICYTTVSRPVNDAAIGDIEDYLDNYIKLPNADEKTGILPLEIKKLVDSRRQVKQLMQDKNLSADLKMQYDIRQKALKLTANSVYGCLGFENSRFYCKPLAALITKNGRNILMKTKELVESKKIEVIYGDTDSIMINTNLLDYDQVFKLGNMIKAEVNKLYKHLEIDIDGVFKSLLLLKKKKYAALTVAGRNPKDNSLMFQQEIKGLDVVRRDWCLLAKQIGEKVISEILSGQSCDVVLTNINNILHETGEKIKNNSYDLALFEISKQLNRNPEEYNDSALQPHVLVALRNNADVSNIKKYKSGNVISYLICEDGTNNSSNQRAYSKSELLKSPDKLKLDTNYYLNQQIHPVITRLCEPIEGIDSYHVAQSLGLDPTGFKHKSNANSGVTIAPVQLSKQQKKLESYMNELEKYTNCVPFKFICPECKTENSWQSAFVKAVKSEVKMECDEVDEYKMDSIIIKKSTNQPTSNGLVRCVLESCSNSTCQFKPFTKLPYLKNVLTMQLNKFIKQYYQGWLICEDQLCGCRTKRISCKFSNGKPLCVDCERNTTSLDYSHDDLYFQMKFFKFIFDVEAYKNYYKDEAADVTNILRTNKEISNCFAQLKEHICKKLKMNAYGSVNLNGVFKYI